MEITVWQGAKTRVAVAKKQGILVSSVQDALDLLATVSSVYSCDALLLEKENISAEFFDLSTRLAGEILQKFVNYGMKLAIIGDFSEGSSSLQDFIRESNKQGHILFMGDKQKALSLLDTGV